jgi:hypothetical protein
MKRVARVFELNEEKGYGEWKFKAFPEFVYFEDYLVLVKEEANYWKGYMPYFRSLLRPDEYEIELDEAKELVRKATNLRQGIYSDADLLEGLRDKYLAEAPVNVHGSRMMTPEQVIALKKEERKLESRIVVKAFDVARLRQEFIDFMARLSIDPRQKYNKKLVKDE